MIRNPRLVIAICTSRPDDLRLRWQHNFHEAENHEFFVVYDGAPDAEAGLLLADIRAAGGTVVVHGRNLGLSPARNRVLADRPDSCVVYIDDDVWLTRSAIDDIAAAFAQGANVVGARLVPPASLASWPWYFTSAQMHLVSWHSPNGPVKTWGACMGIDATFAHQHGLRYDEQLGRSGGRLESGDDTTFVAAMKLAGADERLLEATCVVHDIHPGRLRLRYLMRRVYWQGRSEVRRNQAVAGLRKEWMRQSQSPGARRVLAVPYTAAFVVGVAAEYLSRRPAPTQPEPAHTYQAGAPS